MATPSRIAVIFEDRDILSETQKSEGLNQSWLLLKPQHKTISDVSSHLLRNFDLSRSCPSGIILSMDGFVLPPFESTSFFKDKDVIRVQRRRGNLIGQGATSIEEGEIVEKQSVLMNVPLLTNGEIESKSEGNLTEPEEDDGIQTKDQFPTEDASSRKVKSKKRKASKKLHSPKRNKNGHVDPEDAENYVVSHTAQESCGIEPATSIDRKRKKKKVSKTKTSISHNELAEREDKVVKPSSNRKRSRPIEENGEVHVDEPPTKTRKTPSRSARRKKLKREWLQEVRKAEKKELEASNVNPQMTQSSEKDADKDAISIQQLNGTNTADCEKVKDDDIVPVVVRPGHIRFEPLDEDEDDVPQQNQMLLDVDDVPQRNNVSVDNFQWNGITSKKKGQKWGMEKLPSRRSDYKEPMEYAEMTTTLEVTTPSADPIDFNKLEPFTTLPKEGDMIAYRVLELSTTWTPELSAFRVGKTSWYNLESNRILLTPVPEYPISFDKPDDDEDDEPAVNSLYGEDGSLEIDYSLLNDVRKIQPGNSSTEKDINGKVPESEASAKEVAKSKDGCSSSNGAVLESEAAKETAKSNDGKQIPEAATPEKEKILDELMEAVNAKKAELEQEENGWTESSSRGPWSRRAMRSGALGPTMAILRSKNAL